MARKNTNAPRGVKIIDLGFRKVRIALTLDAMATLEEKFDCDFVEVESFMRSTKDIAFFIATLARGAGEEISEEEEEMIRRSKIELTEIMASIKGTSDVPPGQDTEKNADAPSR